MLIAFREGESRERERERERETLISCFPYAPRPGIEPTAFWVQDDAPAN